jgi:protein gp37
MAKETDIEYCDSTANGQIGCDGCELYLPGQEADATCYAFHWVSRFAGHSKGYPSAFNKPEIFPDRIPNACKWKDLTGTAREHKPWLNGLPRIIFLDDLGDTFTESLPLDWLLPYIPAMEASPHIWLFLTKRPRRMRRFFQLLGRVPRNFWPGTTVTGPENIRRLEELMQIDSTHLWVSLEPLWADVSMYLPRYLGLPYDDSLMNYPKADWHKFNRRKLAWIVPGGESEQDVRPPQPCHPNWLRRVRDLAVKSDTAFFFKQWGAYRPGGAPVGVYVEWVHESGLHYGSGERIRGDQTPVELMARLGKKKAGALLDGQAWHEMPEAYNAAALAGDSLFAAL